MTKLRVLTIVVVVLALVNIAALSALYFGRPGYGGPPGKGGPKTMVIERLHLDAEQVKAYEILIAEHQEAVQRLDAELLAQRTALYQGLKTLNAVGRDSLLTAAANVERRIEATHLEHFTALRMICRPDQRTYYNALVDDLAALFRAPPPKRQ
ncbi:MAG: periplasmic heavy metal sensor [Flavobacteriales bacterium]|jgi:hypothetical protein|nr:periplasmic heavy metal sensor [Flavobacteriales bacterium]MBK6883508.1 periplasmic heavy metal sensor [Flavobacteriales bacterium]MBK7113060.1 periplasmic heavy metal sensor [Flavobacteriales bacterium]MBK7482943.1 periplasmic heavy metal sensor [Flavobacteriales bacterium]MBK7619293.1 periplasmic heavy metal sensor [Flavobacteriales bacterium]